MTNLYKELKDKQQKKVNDFPMKFAFTKEQFKEGMIELGLTENDTDKVFSIANGGFIRRTDSKAFETLFSDIQTELKNEIDRDTIGDGFIADMFVYELNNHEYLYNGDLSDTLDALNLTREDVAGNKALNNGLYLAITKLKEADGGWF